MARLVFALLFATAVSAINPSGLSYKDQSLSSFIDNFSNGLDYTWSTEPLFNDELMISLGVTDVGSLKSSNLMTGAGFPGVAIFDYDGDGDADIYATATENSKNYLYKNTFMQKGEPNGAIEWEESSVEAGIDLTGHDSTGVCFGDINNDGFMDLIVLGSHQETAVFLNNADGTFVDIAPNSGINMAGGAISCTMGDVNGDGYTDLYIGRAHDELAGGCDHRATNMLYFNNGDNTFTEMPDNGLSTFQGLTWAVGFIDHNNDGYLDAFDADDGCLMQTNVGDVGFTRLYFNDGTGHFTDMTPTHSIPDVGGYMGLAWGDFNHDGRIDTFVTDIGHWSGETFLSNFTVENDPPRNSRWLLSDPDYRLIDQGVNAEIGFTPFGWGCSVADFDLTGTTDIVFHGGILGNYFLADNPGVLMINDGTANFLWDDEAFTTHHEYRNVHGVGIGDFNNDGFTDIVSVSNLDYTFSIPFIKEFPDTLLPFGSPFDDIVGFTPHVLKVDSKNWIWNDITRSAGSLKIEIASGDNGNNHIALTPIGSFGIVEGATNARDGFGTVFKVSVTGLVTAMVPVVGGDSQGSQSEPKKTFGLGKEESAAMVEVAWVGGVRNRFYDIPAQSILSLYEVPCDITSAEWSSSEQFMECVESSLDQLVEGGYVESEMREFYTVGQQRGYDAYRDTSDWGAYAAGVGSVAVLSAGIIFLVRRRARRRFPTASALPLKSSDSHTYMSSDNNL